MFFAFLHFNTPCKWVEKLISLFRLVLMLMNSVNRGIKSQEIFESDGQCWMELRCWWDFRQCKNGGKNLLLGQEEKTSVRWRCWRWMISTTLFWVGEKRKVETQTAWKWIEIMRIWKIIVAEPTYGSAFLSLCCVGVGFCFWQWVTIEPNEWRWNFPKSSDGS